MKLYLIPSFISSSQTSAALSSEVIGVVQTIKYFLVENERTTRRFISSLNLGVSIPELSLSVLNKDTGKEDLPKLMKPLHEGHNMGVISEAGCPGIADPGSLAVEYAHKNGIEVVALAGPSSIFLALMSSGFSGQSFCFHGYLPIDQRERVSALKNLEKQSIKNRQTQIFMETPYRNNKLLDTILQTCQPNLKLCIARDLTGEKHFVMTRTIKDWKGKEPDLHKLPSVFLIQS